MALQPEGAQDRGSAPRPWRVVVVDDDADIRSLIRTMLHLDDRFEVVAEASDGCEGLAAIEALRPDVVVLDLFMPVMDGVTAVAMIKDAAPECHIAVCSAHRESAAYVLGVGADAYVDKFEIPRSLARVLDELCATGR